jgi:hypothetical protein
MFLLHLLTDNDVISHCTVGLGSQLILFIPLDRSALRALSDLQVSFALGFSFAMSRLRCLQAHSNLLDLSNNSSRSSVSGTELWACLLYLN